MSDMQPTIIQEISNALAAVGTVKIEQGMTLGLLKSHMQERGFVFSDSSSFLVGESCEPTRDMDTVAIDACILGVKHGRIEMIVSVEDTNVLSVQMLRCDGEFHMEPNFDSTRMTKLSDMTEVSGWFACSNNYIACGPKTTSLLNRIYQQEAGWPFANTGKTWTDPPFGHPKDRHPMLTRQII